MALSRSQLALFLIAVALVAAGTTAVVLRYMPFGEGQSRKLLLRQIDEYDQWYSQPSVQSIISLNGGADFDQQFSAFKAQRPEFATYDAWLVTQQLAAMGWNGYGPFASQWPGIVARRITAAQLRNTVKIDQFYASRR